MLKIEERKLYKKVLLYIYIVDDFFIQRQTLPRSDEFPPFAPKFISYFFGVILEWIKVTYSLTLRENKANLFMYLILKFIKDMDIALSPCS
jgi:hypothetical protein